jgi:hypothetical protein
MGHHISEAPQRRPKFDAPGCLLLDVFQEGDPALLLLFPGPGDPGFEPGIVFRHLVEGILLIGKVDLAP